MCASLCVHKSRQNNNPPPSLKGAAHWIRCPILHRHHHNIRKSLNRDRGGDSHCLRTNNSEQSRAEQQRLLTAELIQSRFLVKRRISAAILPQRQHDNNMRNSPKEQVCLTDFHCGWLMSLWHSQHCSIVQASAAFQSPDVIECVFFMKLQWPLIKHMKSSALIVGQVRKPTCSNQLDDK